MATKLGRVLTSRRRFRVLNLSLTLMMINFKIITQPEEVNKVIFFQKNADMMLCAVNEI